MISHIRGKVYSVEENSCIVDNNGVGYEIFCNRRDLNHISSNNLDSIHLYTMLIHREDSMELYGFLNKIDLSLFKLLLIVKGIGPKQAIRILSEAKSDDIINSIYNEDSNFLKEISGIGKKKAEQIILELKEKIKKRYDLLVSEGERKSFQSEKYLEVVSALESLGFTKKEVRMAMERIMEESSREIENYDTPKLIQKALSLISLGG